MESRPLRVTSIFRCICFPLDDVDYRRQCTRRAKPAFSPEVNRIERNKRKN